MGSALDAIKTMSSQNEEQEEAKNSEKGHHEITPKQRFEDIVNLSSTEEDRAKNPGLVIDFAEEIPEIVKAKRLEHDIRVGGIRGVLRILSSMARSVHPEIHDGERRTAAYVELSLSDQGRYGTDIVMLEKGDHIHVTRNGELLFDGELRFPYFKGEYGIFNMGDYSDYWFSRDEPSWIHVKRGPKKFP